MATVHLFDPWRYIKPYNLNMIKKNNFTAERKRALITNE